jgi:hypothetical protein
MIDYALDQARSEGKVNAPHHQGGLTKATKAKAVSISPPPTADEVDRLYRQLAEIHAISAAQLAECTHWCRFASTSSPVWARTGRQGSDEMLSTTRMALPPSTEFSPQASLQQQGPRDKPSERR